jgi:hypothetical protein
MNIKNDTIYTIYSELFYKLIISFSSLSKKLVQLCYCRLPPCFIAYALHPGYIIITYNGLNGLSECCYNLILYQDINRDHLAI